MSKKMLKWLVTDNPFWLTAPIHYEVIVLCVPAFRDDVGPSRRTGEGAAAAAAAGFDYIPDSLHTYLFTPGVSAWYDFIQEEEEGAVG